MPSLESSKVAQVSLRLWKGILGSPIFSKSGHQERFIRLWQLTGVPLLIEKTHSPLSFFSLCFWRASFVIMVRRLEP